MLDSFFNKELKNEVGRQIFENLKIGKVDEGKYMNSYGKYIVIVLDFKSLNGSDLMGSFSDMISQLYIKHVGILMKMEEDAEKEMNPTIKFLLTMNIESFRKFMQRKQDESLQKSLKFLVELISKHYTEEIVILIDEIDCGIINFIYSNELSKL